MNQSVTWVFTFSIELKSDETDTDGQQNGKTNRLNGLNSHLDYSSFSGHKLLWISLTNFDNPN